MSLLRDNYQSYYLVYLSPEGIATAEHHTNFNQLPPTVKAKVQLLKDAKQQEKGNREKEKLNQMERHDQG